MTIEFESGIERHYLRAWARALDEEILRTVAVTLAPLPPRELGGISLPRTLVRFEGEPNDEQALYDRFYLQFMSAGG